MKKALILCLCFLLCISLFGCVKDSENAGGSEINSESENENNAPVQKIEKFEINSDNWDDYFRYDYCHIVYTDGPGGDVLMITTNLGIALKDGYRIVLDDPSKQSSVAFEVKGEYYLSYVNYDFENRTVEMGEPSGNSHTIPYENKVIFDNACCELNKSYPRGIRSVGQNWVGEVENGPVQEEQVFRILDVTSAQGTVYVYVEE